MIVKPSATSKLNYFFKDGNKRVLEANIDNFLEVKDELVSGGYINIVSDSDVIGQIVDVRIDEAKSFSLNGTIVD